VRSRGINATILGVAAVPAIDYLHSVNTPHLSTYKEWVTFLVKEMNLLLILSFRLGGTVAYFRFFHRLQKLFSLFLQFFQNLDLTPYRIDFTT